MQVAGDSINATEKKKLAEKEVSQMICDLWWDLGVPRDIIHSYCRRSAERPSHAWLVGVADPTGELPAGHVFVTGMHGALASVAQHSTT